MQENTKIHELYGLVSKLLEQKKAQFNWQKIARAEQLLPQEQWRTWLILAGRGFGKTRTGAEAIRSWVKNNQYRRIALIGDTLKDARDVMVEGESGILNISPEAERPLFQSSRGRLLWPNGAEAYLYSAENPESLRGPQFDAAWIDEFAKFRNMESLWTQLNLALRLGSDPRVIITTTPRSRGLINTLVNDPETYVTRGSTFDNQKNLAPGFIKMLNQRFLGTRMGAQEIQGEILPDCDQALWNHNQLENLQVNQVPEMKRIVIAIDPATTNSKTSDETGIVVAGIGYDNRGYVLADLSGKLSPHDWALRAVQAYWHYSADRIVAETNAGGDLVERVLRAVDANVSFKSVKAMRGKIARAEPVAALYEQGKVSHLKGLTSLEYQMCSFNPNTCAKSPDRMDALVWAMTDLMLGDAWVSNPKIWTA